MSALRRLSFGLALGMSVLVGASSTAGARAPDLVVTGASKASKSVAAGSRLKVRATVANRGGARAGRSQVRLYLSASRRWSPSDFELAGGGSVGPLPAGRQAKVTSGVRVPRDAPPGLRFFVLVCADVAQTVNESNELNNCRAAGRTVVVGGSSSEVIDAAVLLGKQKPDQALLYKLFAVFGDRRLPGRYRGNRSPVSGTNVVQEAVERFSSLSPALQAQVRRFLIPPIYQGSFATRAADRAQDDSSSYLNACTVSTANWDSIETGNGVARIWWRKSYPEDAAGASRLKGEFDRTIYPRLTAITTGHTPLPDGHASCGGPDSKLDIYLWPMGSRGEGVTLCSPPAPTTSYVVMDPKGPRSTLAHEFMHVLQNTYRGICDTKWSYLADATATWAEEWVYHFDQSEHAEGDLITAPGSPFGYGRGYPGWAFIYSITQHAGGDAGAVRRLYELAASKSDPLDALAAALPNGLEGAWPAFAQDGWNRPLLPDALKQSFFSWDSWRLRPHGRPSSLRLQGKEFTIPLPIGLTGLGRQYRDLRFDDGTAREITFKDPSAAGVDPHLHTTAFLKFVGDRWRSEDWTGRDKVQFCRDDKEEDVREVVLVQSTSERPPPGSPDNVIIQSDKPKLQLKDRCEIGARLHLSGTDHWTRGQQTSPDCYQTGDSTWQADAEFVGGPGAGRLPGRLGHQAVSIDSIGGSGSGGFHDEHHCADEVNTQAGPMEWDGTGNDDVGVKITPVSGGAQVEVWKTPLFDPGGDVYFFDFAAPLGCQGPHGFIPTSKLGSRLISVALSGNCTGSGYAGGDDYSVANSAGGTLRIHQGS